MASNNENLIDFSRLPFNYNYHIINSEITQQINYLQHNIAEMPVKFYNTSIDQNLISGNYLQTQHNDNFQTSASDLGEIVENTQPQVIYNSQRMNHLQNNSQHVDQIAHDDVVSACGTNITNSNVQQTINNIVCSNSVHQTTGHTLSAQTDVASDKSACLMQHKGKSKSQTETNISSNVLQILDNNIKKVNSRMNDFSDVRYKLNYQIKKGFIVFKDPLVIGERKTVNICLHRKI